MPKSISIYIPDELVRKMEQFSEVNWSEIGRHAIEDYILGRRRYKEMGLELENYIKEFKFLTHRFENFEEIIHNLEEKVNLSKIRPIQILPSEGISFELKIEPEHGSQRIRILFTLYNLSEGYVILDRLVYEIRLYSQSRRELFNIEGSFLRKRKLQSGETIRLPVNINIPVDTCRILSQTVSIDESDINVEVDIQSFFDSEKGVLQVNTTKRDFIAYSHLKKWYNSWASTLGLERI